MIKIKWKLKRHNETTVSVKTRENGSKAFSLKIIFTFDRFQKRSEKPPWYLEATYLFVNNENWKKKSEEQCFIENDGFARHRETSLKNVMILQSKLSTLFILSRKVWKPNIYAFQI